MNSDNVFNDNLFSRSAEDMEFDSPDSAGGDPNWLRRIGSPRLDDRGDWEADGGPSVSRRQYVYRSSILLSFLGPTRAVTDALRCFIRLFLLGTTDVCKKNRITLSPSATQKCQWSWKRNLSLLIPQINRTSSPRIFHLSTNSLMRIFIITGSKLVPPLDLQGLGPFLGSVQGFKKLLYPLTRALLPSLLTTTTVLRILLHSHQHPLLSSADLTCGGAITHQKDGISCTVLLTLELYPRLINATMLLHLKSCWRKFRFKNPGARTVLWAISISHVQTKSSSVQL